MEDLTSNLDDLRKSYREIFLKTAIELKKRIDALKPDGLDGEILDKYEPNSVGQIWQNSVCEMFENDISKEVLRKISEIKQNRKSCHCIGCGTCCKLACSEFSPDELKQKAQNGDNFASQFIQTFIPYENSDEPRRIFPEYLKMLEDNNESGYYFYHCPKVTQDNKCPDYENRPQICRDFPDNPLAFLPFGCGFADWKIKSEPVSLMLNAMVEIMGFYKDKIKELNK